MRISPFALLLLSIQSFAATPNCEHWYQGVEGEAFQTKIDQLTLSKRIDGNEVVIYPEAQQAYQLRQQLIEKAQDHIHVYTLLIEDNETGLASADQLGNKSFLENVEVNLIYSPVTQAISANPRIITVLRSLGVRTHPYWAKKVPGLYNQVIIGPHKKSLIVDSEQYGLEAVVGGRNIGDSYFDNLEDAPFDDFTNLWRDTDILVRGPAIAELVDDFIANFNEGSNDVILGCGDQPREQCHYYPTLLTSGDHEPITLRILENEPNANNGKGNFEANLFYQEMLDHAKYSVLIETPYFIPQEPLLERLYAALNRGVQVRILTNGEKANDRTYSWENEYIFPITNPVLTQEAIEMYENDLKVTGVTLIDQQWFRQNFSYFDRLLAKLFAETLSDLL